MRTVGIAVVLTVLVTFGAVGCRGARTATTSPSSSAPASTASSTTTTVAGSAVSQPTDDVEADLDGVTEQLHQADQDLGDAQTEATTDTRG